MDGDRVLRLVEPDLATTGNPERGEKAPSLVADRFCKLDALLFQLFDRSMHIVAHEKQLVVALTVRGMRGQLGRREREDEPPVTGVDRWEPEYVAEEGARLLGVFRVDDCMRTGDHSPKLAH